MIPYSVKKPLTIFVIMIVIIALGVMSIINMTPDLLPKMDLPYVVVVTPYPGATPEKVESTVTKPLEKALSTVENLKKIQSISSENMSNVVLEFENNTNMDTAVVNILQKVDSIKGSWDEIVSSPYIMKLNPNMLPISVAAVDIKDADTEQVSAFVKDTLINELEGTAGVADISTSGLIEAKVNVSINKDKISKLNEKLLGEANPSLASAQKKIDEGIATISAGEQEIEAKSEELSQKKNETYDQLADASAKLDAAVANAAVIANQVKQVAMAREALDKAVDEAEKQGAPEETIAQLRAQLEALDEQLEKLQIDSDAANKMVSELEKAYKEAQRGNFTAMESFAEGEKQLENAKAQMAGEKEKLEEAKKQLNNAGSQSVQAMGLGALITLDMVSGVLHGQNFSMPAGYIQEDDQRYLVSVGDEFEELDQVENMLLFNIKGLGDVYLKDVADVFIKDNTDTTYARINGNNGVVLSFFKQSNFTTVDTSNNIAKRFEELSKKYENMTFTSLMDQGEYIYLIIGSILKSLLYGAVFSILVLLLFLRDIKPTLITILSIPISLTFAIALMYFSGISINLISLSGLAVAVGMLVDNAIVVIENIFRLRREGVSPKKAAVAGAKEVAGAIVASTLTTVCVFSPIIFVQGITRQLFTDMALTITYSLGASLLIALTLVPALASMIFVKEPKPEGKGLDQVKEKYAKVLSWCLKRKAVPLLLAVVMLIFSVAASISKGFIFIPDMATPQLSGTMTMNNEEATVEETKEMADKVLERLEKIEDLQNVGGMLGSGNMMSQGMNRNSSGSVSLYLIVDDKTKLSGKEIADKAAEVCSDLDCKVEIMSSSSVSSFTSALGGNGVVINLFGLKQEDLQKAAKIVGEKIEAVHGIEEVNNGLVDAQPEIHFAIDKDKAMAKGLTVAQVYMQVSKAMTYEKGAASMIMEGNQYDIKVTSGQETSLTKEKLKDLILEGKDAEGNVVRVTLKEIANLEETQTLPSISREDQRTLISVSAMPKEGYNITLLTEKVKEAMEGVSLPTGVTYEFDGENETIMDSMNDLLLMMALGILLVYLVMVAQFQSLKSPFIVIFTIPLAFTGGLLALLIFGKEISILAMIGLILLVGVIVNNGIVLVDYTNQLRGRGMEKKEAIVAACSTRLRPVLMTSLTTILGLIIMAIGKTAGTDMMQPVALVSVGGLLYATCLTLFIVPIMYDIFNGEEFKVVKKADLDVSDILGE